MSGNIMYILIVAVAVFLGLKILSAPLRLGMKFLMNAGSGFLLLIVCNVLSGMMGFAIPITWLSASIAGFFGLPGVIAIVLYRMFL